jgi:hypothetical protein
VAGCKTKGCRGGLEGQWQGRDGALRKLIHAAPSTSSSTTRGATTTSTITTTAAALHKYCPALCMLLTSQARGDAAELEELRELKRDVERKERQQASIIEGQVRVGNERGRTGTSKGMELEKHLDSM